MLVTLPEKETCKCKRAARLFPIRRKDDNTCQCKDLKNMDIMPKNTSTASTQNHIQESSPLIDSVSKQKNEVTTTQHFRRISNERDNEKDSESVVIPFKGKTWKYNYCTVVKLTFALFIITFGLLILLSCFFQTKFQKQNSKKCSNFYTRLSGEK